jgi:hypothetical protein
MPKSEARQSKHQPTAQLKRMVKTDADQIVVEHWAMVAYGTPSLAAK